MKKYGQILAFIRNFALVQMFVLAFVTACSMMGSKPAWVDGESSVYTHKRYLIAVGSASKPEDARGRALANLARIFEVKIDDASVDRSGVVVESVGDYSQTSRSQTAVRFINTYTTKLLEGAEIVETWYDEEGRQYYSLAAISRKNLSARLTEKILKNDKYTDKLILQAKHAPDPLKSAHYIYKAWLVQYDRENFQKDLQIVDLSGRGIKPRWTTGLLDLELSKKLKKVIVDIKVEKDPIGEFDQILQGGLSAAGVTVNRAKAKYLIQADLDVTDLGKRDDWFWYRGALEIRVIEKQSASAKIIKRWSLKSSGQTKSQTETRLRSQLVKTLKKDLKIALVSPSDKKD